MSDADNPLLRYRFDIPFGDIRPEHVLPAATALIARAEQALAAIREQAGPLTYESTFAAFDHATEELEHVMSVVSHLEAVATNQPLREAYNAAQPKVSAFYAAVPLDTALYEVLRRAASDEAITAALTPAQRRFVKLTLDDFKRHGAGLGQADKERLAALSVELSKLTTQYSQNLLDATSAFEVVLTDERRLGGLPDSAREAARESARAKGQSGYRFTLQQPSYIAVLSYADDAALREQLYRAYNTRATVAPHDNGQLIPQILALRAEKARLLGFANFADLNLEDRMAKNGAKAKAFIEELRLATQAAFERENAELYAFRQSLEGSSAPPLMPWDVGYYAEKLRKHTFDFDEELLRPYFSVDRVLDGMFALVERIYGIRVERAAPPSTYHPDVRYYVLRDGEQRALGAFFADLYPREEKRGGAWMADFITGGAGERHPQHLGVMCANATPPVGDKPALLSHSDVQTLFHEFGHLLHHLLGSAQVRGLAGTRVAWDFVELPSMIMENFTWERAGLDLFARHYQTGEPIPPELLERLTRTRTFRAANTQMRQLGFATIDLALHIDYDPARDGEVLAYCRRLAQPFAAAPLPADYAMIAGFGHLFSSPVGYAAGYYSYKWAEVLEADAFSRFAEAGVLDRQVGTQFRERILSRGNEADPLELYKAFMGREPSMAALLRRAGLAA